MTERKKKKNKKKDCAPGTGPNSQDSATTAACSVRHEIRSRGVETSCSSCGSARLLMYSACSVRTLCRTFWNLALAARAFSFLGACASENHDRKPVNLSILSQLWYKHTPGVGRMQFLLRCLCQWKSWQKTQWTSVYYHSCGINTLCWLHMISPSPFSEPLKIRTKH